MLVLASNCGLLVEADEIFKSHETNSGGKTKKEFDLVHLPWIESRVKDNIKPLRAWSQFGPSFRLVWTYSGKKNINSIALFR